MCECFGLFTIAVVTAKASKRLRFLNKRAGVSQPDLFYYYEAVIRPVKLEFHDADTDTDILARILADTSDTRDWSYSCGKLNDTPTFSRRSLRGCRCRCHGMPALWNMHVQYGSPVLHLNSQTQFSGGLVKSLLEAAHRPTARIVVLLIWTVSIDDVNSIPKKLWWDTVYIMSLPTERDMQSVIGRLRSANKLQRIFAKTSRFKTLYSFLLKQFSV